MTEIERLLIVSQIEIINALRVNNNTIGLGHALMMLQRALTDDERNTERARLWLHGHGRLRSDN